MLNAALAGFGLTYVPEDLVHKHLAKRALIRVLADWCPPFAGHTIRAAANRRQPSPCWSMRCATETD